MAKSKTKIDAPYQNHRYYVGKYPAFTTVDGQPRNGALLALLAVRGLHTKSLLDQYLIHNAAKKLRVNRAEPIALELLKGRVAAEIWIAQYCREWLEDYLALKASYPENVQDTPVEDRGDAAPKTVEVDMPADTDEEENLGDDEKAAPAGYRDVVGSPFLLSADEEAQDIRKLCSGFLRFCTEMHTLLPMKANKEEIIKASQATFAEYIIELGKVRITKAAFFGEKDLACLLAALAIPLPLVQTKAETILDDIKKIMEANTQLTGVACQRQTLSDIIANEGLSKDRKDRKELVGLATGIVELMDLRQAPHRFPVRPSDSLAGPCPTAPLLLQKPERQ